jgi:hypothetical protein
MQCDRLCGSVNCSTTKTQRQMKTVKKNISNKVSKNNGSKITVAPEPVQNEFAAVNAAIKKLFPKLGEYDAKNIAVDLIDLVNEVKAARKFNVTHKDTTFATDATGRWAQTPKPVCSAKYDYYASAKGKSVYRVNASNASDWQVLETAHVSSWGELILEWNAIKIAPLDAKPIKAKQAEKAIAALMTEWGCDHFEIASWKN